MQCVDAKEETRPREGIALDRKAAEHRHAIWVTALVKPQEALRGEFSFLEASNHTLG
jgi:hypothetical protein